MCRLCTLYLGQEVIWHDEFGNSIGPGTVVDTMSRPDVPVLTVVVHSTQEYARLSLAHDAVERVVFSDEQYAALPGIVTDEIRLYLEYGRNCRHSDCGQPRLYGNDECEAHARDAAADLWPDFSSEAWDYWD